MLRARVAAHTVILIASLGAAAYCLLPAGERLARSVAFVTFLSLFAITYSAAAALEALHAGRKADPEDPA